MLENRPLTAWTNAQNVLELIYAQQNKIDILLKLGF